MHSDQHELLIEELHLRGITVDSKEKITEIKKQLINHKYTNTPCDTKDKKFFSPKLLTACEWSKDLINEMLEKIRTLRSDKNESDC